MTVYPDTSVLVAAYVVEADSELAAAHLQSLAPGTVLTSWWTYTEIASALGVKMRCRLIDAQQRSTLLSTIHRRIRKATRIVAPAARDFQYASEMMNEATGPLRGSDALHLAIAASHRAQVTTLDRGMAEAGIELGLDVRLLV